VERFGRIDTLVNNAGIFLAKPFADYTRDEFAAVIGVNVTPLAIQSSSINTVYTSRL